MQVDKQRIDIRDLFHPIGGFKCESRSIRSNGDEPRFLTKELSLRTRLPYWADLATLEHSPTVKILASGTDIDERGAETAAYGELLERLCSSFYDDNQFIVASSNELGKGALDLDSIPRCSAAELANPACPLTVPRKDEPIRWIRALSLLNGKITYVPAVMCFLHIRYLGSGERFWLPISTGCAAHSSLEKAILCGILEVVERDAVSITWLQQLSLPRIEFNEIPPKLLPYWTSIAFGSAASIEPLFFDATTDIGFPTVYGLQRCSANRDATTLVSCSTALDPTEAVCKVIRDMAHIRVAFRNRRPIPEHWDEFSDVFHGASFMARAEQASAFKFLCESKAARKFGELTAAAEPPRSDRQSLVAVTERLRRMALDTYVVELSNDEALRAGLRVVRVLIPGLQPLSVHYCANFLNHDRLYQCPRSMGYKCHAEPNLNKWPQPFA